MKLKSKIIALSLSAVMAASAFAFTACKGNKDDDKTAYVSLDINPEVELVIDKNNNVVSVRGENEDGQVLLYEEAGIKGESVDKAVEKITELAIKYGYLDENNKVVDAIVTSGNEKFEKEVLGKVEASVTVAGENFGLNVKTDLEGAYSLLRKYEEVKDENPDNKDIQKMSVAKFKLALSVSETGDITFEAAVKMDEKELIKTLTVSTKEVQEFATKTYNEAKTKAFAAYDKVTELAAYGVYTEYGIQKTIKTLDPLYAYNASMFQLYASASKSVEAIAKVADLYTDACAQPLTEEQIAKVVAILGLENSDPIKNSDGTVTIDSIEAYADKVFKNSEAGQELEAKKAELTKALNDYESAIKAQVEKLKEEYKPQIEAAVCAINDMVTVIEASLPESVKTMLDNSINELKETVEDLKAMTEDGTITVEELYGYSDKLQEKADKYLTALKGSLTEDELKEIETRKEKVISKMTSAKTELNNALTKAETEARAYLESLKNTRIEINGEVTVNN